MYYLSVRAVFRANQYSQLFVPILARTSPRSLSLADSAATFSSDIKVIKAFTGQDVVISVVASTAATAHFEKILIDAALEADVKWIIPTTFGPPTSYPAAASNLILSSKTTTTDLLDVRHLELNLHKSIYLTDTTFTQQQASSLFEKYTKTKWAVKKVTTVSLVK